MVEEKEMETNLHDNEIEGAQIKLSSHSVNGFNPYKNFQGCWKN